MKLKALLDLSGRAALVTGGSRGLGLQMAEALGELGARVALVARKRDELDQAVAHLAAQGIDALALPCDLLDPTAIAPMVARAHATFGNIDILVNNAGATWGAPTTELPLTAWHKVLSLNLTAMFLVTQEVGRRSMLPRREGRIVNVASILGLGGGNGDPRRPPTIAYNTSKGGVVNFTRALAVEWGPHNINVNAIAPGFFPTRMTQGLLEMIGEDAALRAPLKRMGGPEDLKGVVALLASDAGAFITGQVIAVDGGVTAM
ncbi:MAG TPA: SDR family oxidoreductase [Casimicrobiaceae bacterium]|nr:SDR family oxidoreductase [Casimicrobiaceae bacterium]